MRTVTGGLLPQLPLGWPINLTAVAKTAEERLAFREIEAGDQHVQSCGDQQLVSLVLLLLLVVELSAMEQVVPDEANVEKEPGDSALVREVSCLPADSCVADLQNSGAEFDQPIPCWIVPLHLRSLRLLLKVPS